MSEQEREGHEFRACPSEAEGCCPQPTTIPKKSAFLVRDLPFDPVIFITDSLIVSVIEFL
jgi:hypothetical protein